MSDYASDADRDERDSRRRSTGQLLQEEERPNGAPSKRHSNTSLSRNASLASLADVLNGNDERELPSMARAALAAFLRGATVGGSLKARALAARLLHLRLPLAPLQGGLALLGLLVKMRKKGLAARGALGTEVKSAMRYALFLGCYASGFRLVEGALASVAGSHRWRAAAAGLVVAPTFLLADAAPSSSLSVYVALRAVLLALRSSKRNKQAFTGPVGSAVFNHGPVLSMCAAASVLLHGWLLEPASLDNTYVRFLDRHGGKGRPIIDALSHLTSHGSIGAAALPAVRAWYTQHQAHACASLDAVTGACCHPCDIVHPGQGHLMHALQFAVRGVPAALPVYLPVYAVSTALVQRGNLLKQPGRVLTRAGLGVLRSSAFLSSYCALAWLSCCTVHNAAGVQSRKVKMSRFTVLLCSLPAGLATLIEKPSRRTELALFCTGHALQSAARCALMWGWIRPVRRADVALLMLSSSYIMHTYINQPESFRSSFRNVFDWIFGYSWRRRGSFVSLLY
jgi:hypothetical protein